VKKLLLLLPLFLAACGADDQSTRMTTSFDPECEDAILSLTATNCSTPGPTPPPAPTGPASTLTITGPVPAPSGAGWTTEGFVRVPTSTTFLGWQSLGLSTSTVAITKVYASSITTSGSCQQVDLKMITGLGAPTGLRGNFYNQSRPDRFKYCVESGSVIAGYEDGADTNFSDFKVKISSNLGSLNYELRGNNLFVCLD